MKIAVGVCTKHTLTCTHKSLINVHNGSSALPMCVDLDSRGRHTSWCAGRVSPDRLYEMGRLTLSVGRDILKAEALNGTERENAGIHHCFLSAHTTWAP